MRFLSDDAVAHLREITEMPDLGGTRYELVREREGKQIQFGIFEAYDLDEDRGVSYRELATRFDIPETQVTNFLSATRRRFREIVLDTLREVTATDQEFRAEAHALLGTSR